MVKLNPVLGGVISIKTHKKHLNNKVAHHASVHKEHEHDERKKTVPKKRSTSQENTTLWKTTTFALAVLLVLSIFTQGFSDINLNMEGSKKVNEKTQGGVDEKLPVELYVMSQCPYGVQAEDTMFPAIQALGEENFDLQVHYISTDLGNGQFDSLHGEPETQGNIVQLCAQEVDESKFLDLVLCMNKNPNSIPGNWEACAESLEYDVEAIRTCYEGSEGPELLSASAAATAARGASGSPTIYVGNERYSGGREEIDFKRAFCSAFTSEVPEGCNDLPPVKEFEVITLTDKTCSSCDTTSIISATKGFFPGATVRTVDVSSSEGQELINAHDIQVVPAYIFAKGVVETQAWQDVQFQTNFESLDDGSYKLLDAVTGATWFVSEEKRTERLAEMGITVGDNRPQIDFFIMSYCPYGNQAEEGIVGAYEELKNEADFFPRYIYYENYGGGGPNYCLDEENKLCSMHGVVEARQNVREQCVAEEYGMDAWFDFAIAMNSKCTSQNADTCYVDVAEDLGYDVDFIASCEEERAIEFATEDARLQALFGASGSPSVYIDGATYTGTRAASGYQAALCAAFEDAPASCDGIEVVAQTATAAPAPQGQC